MCHKWCNCALPSDKMNRSSVTRWKSSFIKKNIRQSNRQLRTCELQLHEHLAVLLIYMTIEIRKLQPNILTITLLNFPLNKQCYLVLRRPSVEITLHIQKGSRRWLFCFKLNLKSWIFDVDWYKISKYQWKGFKLLCKTCFTFFIIHFIHLTAKVWNSIRLKRYI